MATITGHGALAQGGISGQVIHVANLNDSGPGSLREAITCQEPRHIVFDVAGYIDLQSSLEILSPYITIAGETAPAPGITLRKAFDVDKLGSIGGCIKIGRMAYGNPEYPFFDVHDVVVRHLRMRHGDGQRDVSAGLVIHAGHEIVIDHCSFSWSPDNLLTIWLTINDPPIYNVTIQRCLFGEPLASHPTALAIHGHYDFVDPENPNQTYKRISNISVHHNFFAGASHRIPMTRTSGVQTVNNLIYNFDYKTFQPNADDASDFENNYIRCGPQLAAATINKLEYKWLYQLSQQGFTNPASIFVQGNIVEEISEADEDDWPNFCEWFPEGNIPLDPIHRRLTRLPLASVPVTRQPAADIVDDILADCGATRPARDVIDERLIDEFMTRTGISTYLPSVADAGGWPEL